MVAYDDLSNIPVDRPTTQIQCNNMKSIAIRSRFAKSRFIPPSSPKTAFHDNVLDPNSIYIFSEPNFKGRSMYLDGNNAKVYFFSSLPFRPQSISFPNGITIMFIAITSRNPEPRPLHGKMPPSATHISSLKASGNLNSFDNISGILDFTIRAMGQAPPLTVATTTQLQKPVYINDNLVYIFSDPNFKGLVEILETGVSFKTTDLKFIPFSIKIPTMPDMSVVLNMLPPASPQIIKQSGNLVYGNAVSIMRKQ